MNILNKFYLILPKLELFEQTSLSLKFLKLELKLVSTWIVLNLFKIYFMPTSPTSEYFILKISQPSSTIIEQILGLKPS